MKTIGIVGSRRRDSQDDFKTCWNAFLTIYEDGDRIVSGGCKSGGDSFAEIIAGKFGLSELNGGLIIHRADWKRYGKRAGFIRNTDIAMDADVVIAIVASDRTGGTEDTIRKATMLRKHLIVTTPTNEFVGF
jgi:hypothetical protein